MGLDLSVALILSLQEVYQLFLSLSLSLSLSGESNYRAKDTVVIKGAVVIYRRKESHVKKGNTKVIRQQAHCNRPHIIIFYVVFFFFIVNNDY